MAKYYYYQCSIKESSDQHCSPILCSMNQKIGFNLKLSTIISTS